MRDRESMLAAMLSGRFPMEPDENGAFFIDRDPTHFRHILNFLRDGSINFNEDNQLDILREAKFYQIRGLISLIENQKAKAKESTQYELTQEKEYRLVPDITSDKLGRTFTDMTVMEGYDFESWVPASLATKGRESYHILFSKKLSKSELALLDRLGHHM
eukprot:TRINITY_DN2926_c0_g1_i3.p1 TRINITY_DN2926_c0_g1~~TRINITY_DN2926_c0_g1_i3.p1  ORF type:complete len:160 (+),score=41.79 TRINITY_DN2926_c0_g1_i3:36-515(+)